MTPPEIAQEAKNVIEKCRTDEGFFASGDLYRDLWLRDFVYSENVLLELGYHENVRRHLETFLKHQLENGQIPTVIPKGWKYPLISMFHFWTADTEILFVLGMMTYFKITKDHTFIDQHQKQIEKCVEFVRAKTNSLGLIPGYDWRDAMTQSNHATRYFLSNQVLLVQMYDELGRKDDSKALKEIILDLYFSQPKKSGSNIFPTDCICQNDENIKNKQWKGKEEDSEFKFENRLDCFGSSLAILGEIVAGNDAIQIVENIDRLARTEYGYKNIAPPVKIERLQAFASINAMRAFVKSGAFVRNRPNHYQNSAIWPFVEARIVSAFKKVGFVEKARELSNFMLYRKGLNEWYSPKDGQPLGSRDQLWTAAAVLEQILL
jgi:glycogen debranching enzyme